LTDANSCTTTDSVIINKFICPVISFNTQVEENTCFNTCDGYIAVKNISNAVAPLIFNWNTGMSSDSIGSLCSGNYSVSITDIKNCSTVDSFYIAQPDSLTIIVDSLQNYSQNSKGFINIHNSTDDKFSFSWTGPDGFVSAESDIYNLLPGCYHLILTDTLTGCESDTTICISNLTSSLNLSDANDINIFPNPASGSVMIDFHDCTSIIKEIILLDNSGKTIKSEIVSKRGSVHLLDLTSLNPGMHFVKILFQNEAKYYKLIVH
jgi:hypothetical protein